ncbi:MSP domain protein [Dictyocaulus viviparus]|uniref:Major sperm protein n=1 Tax=Dictyocaulus viviparus TaxID=29172 RepID=A0A0D8XZJ5_DICVI|nr:MSP domain protein [Dictyocaulus viviparus]
MVVRLNTAGSDEPITTPVVFIDQTLVVFDVEQRKNASQILQLSRVSKNAIVSYRFQTNAPTRYIVNPNCGVITDNKPISVKIELIGNRFNPQHKIVLHATQIDNINDWKTIWDDPKMDEPGAYQIVWIELSTTVMNLEHTLNLADQECMKPSSSVSQILSASNSVGAERVKELEDLKAMLMADNETILKNIEQTVNLKKVIEKQLAERKAEANDLHIKVEKLAVEESHLYADLMREENELRLTKERRGSPENCVTM